MEAAQTYETTIYDRESRRAFTFVTLPGRSFVDGIPAPNATEFARRLDLREPRFGKVRRSGSRPWRHGRSRS